MKISIVVNEVSEGWSPASKRLGGTEESVVWWAKILRQRGHSVAVFHNGDHAIWHGVVYAPREKYIDGDVCLNIKSLDIPTKVPTLYFTNETDASEKDLSAYDTVAVPSQWAKDNLYIRHDNVVVIPHGYDPVTIKVGKKVPKQVLYSSSPDRGLARLLKTWPHIVKYHPDAILIVTYAKLQDFGFTTESLNAIPNILILEGVDEDTMAELYQSSDIWTHPCNGGELFCISGIKAQVTGAVPVIFPTMALSETVRHGVFSSPETYTGDMVSILGDNKRKDAIRQSLREETYADWEASTSILETFLCEIAQKANQTAPVAK